MENSMYVIETALLLLVAFLIGCAIGYMARRMVRGGDVTSAPDEAKRPDETEARAGASPKIVTTAPARAASTPKPEPQAAVEAPAPEMATEEPKTPTPAAPAGIVAETSQTAAPSTLAAPRGGKKDNLKKIKGIGPKIETALNDAGIFHFDQIAAWTRMDIDWIDNHLSFKGRIDRENWVSQAKELANT